MSRGDCLQDATPFSAEDGHRQAGDARPSAEGTIEGDQGQQLVIIGAGPAGLTAAYEATKFNLRPVVLERRDKVGGISCTEQYRGFYFDMGGHRFFTKVKECDRLWREVLGDKFLRRPRTSRIYYNRRFFCYPLKPINALLGLGFWQSILVLLSYIKWQLLPHRQEDTFEQWVTNRFGQRLFRIFFKTYTEKLWGIPCSELKAEWAAQRIKDLSLRSAVLSMFVRPRKTIKTLINEFHYPQFGPGMLWAAVKSRIERQGGRVYTNSDVVQVRRTGSRIDSVIVARNGHREVVSGNHFISSMPLREFITKLDPAPPPRVMAAAEKLHYRDFLIVCLVVNATDLFPDNWIYVHDPSVRVGRIQNFKNWSPYMVPDSSKTSLGLEYFCNEGDDLWNSTDADLIELGRRELERIGLASYSSVEDGCVFRVPKAYPVYDSDYREQLPALREFMDGLVNLQTVGRNGLHRYNNQDHAMLTGILAVRNIALGEKNVLWNVNADQEYHEELEVLQAAIGRTFLKLDRVAFGLSLGVTTGVVLFLATLILVLKGGEVVGPRMWLLSQYFPGYTVSMWGSLLGLVYGMLVGFLGGWTFAFLRNAITFLAVAFFRRGAELSALRRVLEYM